MSFVDSAGSFADFDRVCRFFYMHQTKPHTFEGSQHRKLIMHYIAGNGETRKAVSSFLIVTQSSGAQTDLDGSSMTSAGRV